LKKRWFRYAFSLLKGNSTAAASTTRAGGEEVRHDPQKSSTAAIEEDGSFDFWSEIGQ
jgi:hypothetical protein